MDCERVYEDNRFIRIEAPPGHVWSVVERIGGENGWYYADWLWRFRGFLDRLCGGVGLRPDQKRNGRLAEGDTVGFWKVISAVPNDHLLLLAEMKLPGRATLRFEIKDAGQGACELHQVARFWSSGFFGALYWYSLMPIHCYLFRGMIRKIGQIALRNGSLSRITPKF